MNRRRFWPLGVLVVLLLATTAVVAQNTLQQTVENFAYLPLIAKPSEPIILSFQVAPDHADPGQTVTLTWEVTGADQIVLTRFWDYRPAEWWEGLPASGIHTHIVPDWERNPILFMLDAFNSVTGNHVAAGVTITVICPDTWFFDPPLGGCPTAPVFSPAAEQLFEGGVMIWVGTLDNIIVLFADTLYPKVSTFSDSWNGDPICDLGPPPEGKLHPVRGFGYLWCENEMVRERLGWATEPEVGFGTVIQWTTLVKYNHTYLQASDGNVWHLFPESSGWEKIIVSP